MSALLAPLGERAPYIDIAWNTNLAYLQADAWSGQRCRPIAMRDTDIGWMTKIVAATGGPLATLADLRGRTLALGSRDSGHAAILPVYFLEKEGLQEGKDYRALRFNSDLGKHGDTGASEVEVVRAILDGRADAGAIGSPFWKAVKVERLVPQGALTEIWTSPPYNHCMTVCSWSTAIAQHYPPISWFKQLKHCAIRETVWSLGPRATAATTLSA